MLKKLFLLCLFLAFYIQAEEKINAEKPGIYMGRQIAWTMHATAADWLIRNGREREESAKEMLAALELKPGMVVADVGCGIGYHALPMALTVGETGKILCVDVQQAMLDRLKLRAEKAGIKNYEAILGEYEDPKLPENSVDLILLVDSYHEFNKPQEMLAAMRKSLRKDGVIVLLEFRKEDNSVPIKEDHKMSKEQIDKELSANGFKLIRSYEKLPWQHMMFFGKDK